MTRWLARLMTRWLARQADPALVIPPPVRRFDGFDPDLRDRTAARRKAADGIRTRANAVASGATTSDLLRRVR